MSTKNSEIATSNNEGTQKAHWKHPKKHQVGYEIKKWEKKGFVDNLYGRGLSMFDN